MDRNINELAKYWASSSVFDVQTKKEIQHLLDSGNDSELAELFYKDLEFGTGGLRGILGAGSSRMNIYNVRKASQSFADYLNEYFAGKKIKIAISYDSRRFSPEFARATAEVMAGNGIESYITKQLRPTPMLSFMVRHFACQGGVCVTASHNPPNYNGYKVYWETGAQVVAPHDKKIIERYLSMPDYESIRFMDYETAVAKGFIHEVGEDFDRIYFDKVVGLKTGLGSRDIDIVVTPLHGTGAYPIKTCLEAYGFKQVHLVKEQAEPDGEFPTVEFPNPEDPKALEMALELGKKLGAELILATDPDGDRIGMIVKDGSDYIRLNGNQIGCLLIDFLLNAYKSQSRLPENPLVIKTIVTTDMQEKIARKYGAQCLETLTGFKWICQLVEEFESGARKPYQEYVCGGEESYGFLAGHFVRDKDAVSACCLAAEMVASLKDKGEGVGQALDRLFMEHGVYLEDLHTLTLPGREGAEKISAMMERLRVAPPKELAGFRIEKVRDLATSIESTQTSSGFEKTASIDLPASNVLQFLLEDGSKVSARPSGTEPKIKFYISVYKESAKDLSREGLESLKLEADHQLIKLKEAILVLA